MNAGQHSQRGINLIEVLIAIAIAALSLTVGIPSFESLRVRSDRSSAIIEIVSAARLARSESALRGISHTLCASTDGATCSGSTDWTHGWIVFRDPDSNGAVDQQADVISSVAFRNPRFTLAADDTIGDSITFGTFGYPKPSHGTITYTDPQTSRSLQLTYIGRLHVNQPIQTDQSS